jgi:hypothetical protein
MTSNQGVGSWQWRAVTSAKCLGVTITDNVNWSQHVDSITNKAHTTLGFLPRNLKFTSISTVSYTFLPIFVLVSRLSLFCYLCTCKTKQKWQFPRPSSSACLHVLNFIVVLAQVVGECVSSVILLHRVILKNCRYWLKSTTISELQIQKNSCQTLGPASKRVLPDLLFF